MIVKPNLRWNADKDVLAVRTYVLPYKIMCVSLREDDQPYLDDQYIDDIGLILPVYLYLDDIDHIPEKQQAPLLRDPTNITEHAAKTNQKKLEELQIKLFRWDRVAYRRGCKILDKMVKEMTRNQKNVMFVYETGYPREIECSTEILDKVSIV